MPDEREPQLLSGKVAAAPGRLSWLPRCGQWLRPNLWLILVTLLGLALRLYGLSDKSLWHDELGTLTYVTSEGGWLDTIRDPLTTPTIPIPPLFFLITRLFMTLGQSVFLLRLPSVLFSALTVPLAYLLGRTLFDRDVGLLGAALLAISPLHIRYAQEARSYAMMACLSILGLYLFWRAAEGETRRWWTGFAVVAVLGLYTHLFTLLSLGVIGILGLFILVQRRGTPHVWRFARRYVVSLAVIALCYAPLISFLLQGLRSERGVQVDAGSLGGGLDWSFASLWGIVRQFGGASTVGAALCLSMAAVAGVTLARRRSDRLWGMILWIVLPVVVVLSLPFAHRVLIRYFLFALPLYLLLVGYGLNLTIGWLASFLRRPQRWPSELSTARAVTAILVLLVVTGITLPSIASYYEEGKQDWRGATRVVLAAAEPGDGALVLDERHRTGVLFYAQREGRNPGAQAELRVGVLSEVTAGETESTAERQGWLIVPFGEAYLPQGPGLVNPRLYRFLPPVVLKPAHIPLDSEIIAPFSFQPLAVMRYEQPVGSREPCQPGDRERVESWIRSAQELEAVNVDGELSLALLAYYCGNFPEAAQRMSRAIERDPGNTQLYRLSGMVAEAQERWDDALADYQRTLELDPAAVGALVRIGNTYRSMGNWQLAEESYHRALDVDAGWAWPHFELARLYEETGQVERALPEYRQAIAGDPDNSGYHIYLGDALLTAGEPLAALSEYEEALASRPDLAQEAWYHARLGNASRLAGDRDQAIAAYEQALALDPGLAAVWQRLGDLYFDGGQTVESVAPYQQATLLQPDSAGAFFRLCRAYHRLGEGYEEEALDICQRTVALQPTDAWSRVLLGDAYRATLRGEEALFEYRQAIRLNLDYGDEIWYYLRLGDAYQLVDETEEAIAAYEHVLALDQGNMQAIRRLRELR